MTNKSPKISREIDIYKEAILIAQLALKSRFARPRSYPGSAGKILIINTCLIGEFVASLPAIIAFIEKNPDTIIDILVTPPVKLLAEKIIGIRSVFTAKSVFERPNEHQTAADRNFDVYEKTIIMLLSGDSYALLRQIKTEKIQLRFQPLLRYGLHLGWCLLLGKTPRPWASVDFALLDLVPTKNPTIAFDQSFVFNQIDKQRIRSLPILQTSQKKILIHTGAGWLMKAWKNDRWILLLKELCSKGDFRFIFIGNSAREREDYEYISERLSFPVYSLIDHTTLPDLLLLMRECQYFIGIDSGMRNLAHITDIPSITLLGPAPHMYPPLNRRDIVIDKSAGRGVLQYFIATKNPIVDKISVHDVLEAFNTLMQLP